MKIMIDATSLFRTMTGIENYTKNLVEHIVKNASSDDKIYVLFRVVIPEGLKDLNGYTPIICPVKSQVFCEQIWIPFIKSIYRPDIMHFPAFPPGLFVFKNIFFTVHDATMWLYPETLSWKNKLYMKPLSNLGIKKAKKVITVSESSKDGLQKLFPNDHVVNCGISISEGEFFDKISNDKKMEVRNKYKLPSKYFLTVGSLEPRKNFPFLLKAFAEYKKNTNNDIKLVITGRSAWGSSEINEFIQKHNIKNDVIFTGYIDQSDLPVIYNLAYYFVFPSIYEGFGLPVLEAMACGTPVIVSDTSSIPEVSGNAGLYFKHDKIETLTDRLFAVTNNEELREEQSLKALRRSESFNWKEIAEKMLCEYKS